MDVLLENQTFTSPWWGGRRVEASRSDAKTGGWGRVRNAPVVAIHLRANPLTKQDGIQGFPPSSGTKNFVSLDGSESMRRARHDELPEIVRLSQMALKAFISSVALDGWRYKFKQFSAEWARITGA